MPTNPSATAAGAMNAAEFGAVIDGVASRARASGLFGDVTVERGVLSLAAPNTAAPAYYRVFAEGGRAWVALVTPDRYLSQSVEQDLVHTGDKLGDLIADELVDVEHPSPYTPVVEHFRDPEKLFTFRSAAPEADLAHGAEEAARRLWLTLRAYAACFANLGDIDADEED